MSYGMMFDEALRAFETLPCDDCGMVPEGAAMYAATGVIRSDGRVEKHCGCVARAAAALDATASAVLGEELAAAALKDLRAGALSWLARDLERYKADEVARLERERRMVVAAERKGEE